jgi:hypothetical protein
VTEFTGFDADSDLHGKIVSAYNALKAKAFCGANARRENTNHYTQ